MAKLTTIQLATLLNDIKAGIEAGDSFEGNLEYTCMAKGLQRGEWEVRASYRVGNSQGQGGMIIIDPTSPKR